MIRIDRLARKPLVSQLEIALRQAILKGEYKPGELLPGFRELSRACKVSEKVSRQALVRLAQDGWITQRRGVGSVVVERQEQEGCGRVLLVECDFGIGQFATRMKLAMRRVLEDRGFRLTEIDVYDGRGRIRIDRLEEELRHRSEVVIEHGYQKDVRRILEGSGLPFVTLANGDADLRSDAASSVGFIKLCSAAGLSGFIRACVRKRLKTVWQFIYGGGAYDITGWMKTCDIAVRTFSVPLSLSTVTAQQSAYELTKRQIRQNELPDVLLLTDDALAQGALFALAEQQVRVPEDVRVVSLVNKELRWLWPRPLARLEMDPRDCGKTVARAVLDHLRTGRKVDVQIGAVWREGETF